MITNAIDALNNLDEFFKQVGKSDTAGVELTIAASGGVTPPDCCIYINGVQHVCTEETGILEFNFEFNLAAENEIIIEMTNKDCIVDTQTDIAGNFLFNKSIMIQSLLINECNMLRPELISKFITTKLVDSSNPLPAHSVGLWFNGKIKINIPDSCIIDYALITNAPTFSKLEKYTIDMLNKLDV